MAQNISDTIITNTIDHMTAVTKGFVASYVTTEAEDLFQVLVREQNPDDLVAGVGYAETVDDSLAAGTSYYSMWTSVLSWLNSRATSDSALYTSLDNMLIGRGLRVPHTFTQYIYYQIYNTNTTSANVFPDQYWNGSSWVTYNLGDFTFGGTYTADETLPTSVTSFWGSAVATVAGPGDWTITADVTYPDASTGTETIVLAGGSSATAHNIGSQVLKLTTLSAAGQKKVYIDTPVGFVAGQSVLIWTGEYHALLTADANSGQAQLYISPGDVGTFDIGDLVSVDDGDSAEENTHIINDINYEIGLITLRSNLANNMTVAQNAMIYKRSTSIDTVGNAELHVIDSVTTGASGYLTLLENLQHSYYSNGCKAIRLISSVDDTATVSGGAGGDTVAFKPVVERTITQGSII